MNDDSPVSPGPTWREWWHALVVHKRTSSRVTKCSLADDVSRETLAPGRFTTIAQFYVAPDQRVRELLDISGVARSSLLELNMTDSTTRGDEMTTETYSESAYIKTRVTCCECCECGRVFNLFDERDADEWIYGHDCEL